MNKRIEEIVNKWMGKDEWIDKEEKNKVSKEDNISETSKEKEVKMDVQVTNSYRLKLGNVIGEVSKTGDNVDWWAVLVVDNKDNVRGKIYSHYEKWFERSNRDDFITVGEVDVDIEELYEMVKEIRRMIKGKEDEEDNSKFKEVKYGI